MNTLSVSSYSVREQLGPVEFSFTDGEGIDRHVEFPFPKLLELPQFPVRAKGDLGVDAIETVAFQFKGLDDPELDAFELALASSGVTLINAAIDAGDLLEPDEQRRAADVAELQRWIARFATMGSKFVRVNPGSPFSTHHGDTPPTHLVDALVELGGFAQSTGTRLLVENHGGASSDPAWLNALLDAVGSEHLGLLLDLGNFDALTKPVMAMMFGGADFPFKHLVAGIDLEPVYAGIEALAPRAELVHVKVHDVDEDGAIRAVDLERALGILLGQGYAGPLTVEYEGQGGDPWEKTRRVVDEVRRIAATAPVGR